MSPRDPQAELKVLAAQLEGRPPAEIMAAAVARHPGRIALACSFGAEDCLLVHLVATAGLLVDVFTLDTGYLFPETYQLWRELEARYRIRIWPGSARHSGRPREAWRYGQPRWRRPGCGLPPGWRGRR